MDELIDLLPTLLALGLLLHVFRKILRNREHHQGLEKAWAELASLTGLSFNPGNQASFQKNGQQPQLSGIFHGRQLTLTKVVEWSSFDNGSNGFEVPIVFTEIKISVENTACSSLSVEGGGFLSKIFRKNVIVSGDKEFDKRFTVKGSPSLFVRRALALIVVRKSLFLKRLEGTILLTDNAFSGTTWKRPSIELNGSELVCRQHGILTDLQTQIVFLNLLCDLAELAERMGSHNGSISQTVIDRSGN